MAPTKRDLAKILVTLPYGVMREVAKELVEMNGEDGSVNRHPETITGMAETLYDWGEAYDHDDQ